MQRKRKKNIESDNLHCFDLSGKILVFILVLYVLRNAQKRRQTTVTYSLQYLFLI